MHWRGNNVEFCDDNLFLISYHVTWVVLQNLFRNTNPRLQLCCTILHPSFTAPPSQNLQSTPRPYPDAPTCSHCLRSVMYEVYAWTAKSALSALFALPYSLCSKSSTACLTHPVYFVVCVPANDVLVHLIIGVILVDTVHCVLRLWSISCWTFACLSHLLWCCCQGWTCVYHPCQCSFPNWAFTWVPK